MPDSLVSVIVAAAASFAVALGTLWLARKSGIDDVQREAREERTVLVAALKGRIEHLETENEQLRADVDYLKRENEQLRIEIERLRRAMLKREVGDASD